MRTPAFPLVLSLLNSVNLKTGSTVEWAVMTERRDFLAQTAGLLGAAACPAAAASVRRVTLSVPGGSTEKVSQTINVVKKAPKPPRSRN